MLCLFPIAWLALAAPNSPSSAAPATSPEPPMATLLQAVVARDAQTQRELKSMQYREHIQTDRLDPQGKVTQHQDMQLLVRPGGNPEIQVLSVHGPNMPSNPDEAAAQAKKQQAQQRQQNFDLKSISARFNLTMLGRSNELGADAYVIGFEPKPNQPYHTQTEKVLNQLHGRIWIRASDDLILRTEASLLHPVQVAWIFASVTSLDFHYELPPGGSVYGPAWLETSVRVNAPLLSIAQHQRIDMTDFQPRKPLLPSRT
jgi:hypothetical protein